MFRAGNGASRIVRAIFALAVVASAAVPASAGADPGNAAPGIEAVSTKAEYVSGGDVLVRVQTHDAGAATHLRIELDGVDVMSSFHGQPDGSLLGLVGGMSVGPHTILARANGKGKGTPPGRSAALDIVNPSDHGCALLGPAAAAVLLRDDSAGVRARARLDRRHVLGADTGDVPVPHDRRSVRDARGSHDAAG